MSNSAKPFRNTLTAVCVVAAGLMLLGCSRKASHGSSADAKLRIVSLAPSVTEILFALDMGYAVVGATDYCVYPPEAKCIERVGGFGTPNLEKLLAVSPSLVIAAGFEREEVAQSLRGSGIKVLEVRIHNFDELFEAIREIGQAIDVPQAAERMVTRMLEDLDAIAVRVHSVPPSHRPKVFVEIGDHPLMTAGAASFLDDLIARAGGVNLAHAIPQAYPQINPEQVVAWDPDVILVAQMQRPQEALARLGQRIGWSNISAIKHGRVISDIDPDVLLRPGPRLIDGIKVLADRLNAMPFHDSQTFHHANQN